MGTNAGGRLCPESLMDDEFVSSRMRVEFPNGADGESVITIGREVLDVMNSMWKQCMVVKVLGRNISIANLNRRLREMWKPQGAMFVVDLPCQFFMIRFEREDEYLSALTGGPWRAFGSYLLVQAWSPEFDPLRDEITTTPIWVRLMNIPLSLYHTSILMGIAGSLGKPVKVDMTTLHVERARFARMCIEVDLAKPLKGTLLLNGERYFVSYEGLANICSRCGMYGHLIHTCPQTIAEKEVNAASQSAPVVVSGAVPENDGFTVVRRSRKKAAPPQVPVVNGIEGPTGVVGRNLREITQGKNSGNILVSNSFGNLDIESSPVEGSEADLSGVQNKENVNTLRKFIQGKSISQDKEGIREGIDGGGLEIRKIGLKGGLKDRRAGFFKPNDQNRQKAKQNTNRPTKGLVFGPTKGEVVRSETGKRLRVEKGTMGRRGGIFVTRTEMEKITESALLSVRENEMDTTSLISAGTRVEGGIGVNGSLSPEAGSSALV